MSINSSTNNLPINSIPFVGPVETQPDTTEFTPEENRQLYTMLGGHSLFACFRAASKFDLFSILSSRGKMTCGEIAKSLGIAIQPARIMLLPLVMGGALKKEGQYYSNTRLAESLLVRGAPDAINECIEWQQQIVYPAIQHLYEALQTNQNVGLKEFAGDEPTLYQRLVHDPKRERVFQNAMQEISVQANRHFAENVDFSEIQHLVDVGGGNGTNAMALASRWPHLRVTVFDSASVCEIAEANIAKAGMSDRVGTFVGNCFESEFPLDADCLLFSHFFTIWSPEKNQFLLKKSFDSLPSGGKVMLFNMMQHDDETGPWSAAIGSPYFLALATGEGMLYTWQEYESWMQSVGFAQTERHELPKDHGVILGIKA